MDFVENKHGRRPDIVIFVNGLPLAVLELKNAITESATIWTVFNQLQTCKAQIPSLFAFNTALVISGGVIDIFAAAGLTKPDISVLSAAAA